MIAFSILIRCGLEIHWSHYATADLSIYSIIIYQITSVSFCNSDWVNEYYRKLTTIFKIVYSKRVKHKELYTILMVS